MVVLLFIYETILQWLMCIAQPCMKSSVETCVSHLDIAQLRAECKHSHEETNIVDIGLTPANCCYMWRRFE